MVLDVNTNKHLLLLLQPFQSRGNPTITHTRPRRKHQQLLEANVNAKQTQRTRNVFTSRKEIVGTIVGMHAAAILLQIIFVVMASSSVATTTRTNAFVPTSIARRSQIHRSNTETRFHSEIPSSSSLSPNQVTNIRDDSDTILKNDDDDDDDDDNVIVTWLDENQDSDTLLGNRQAKKEPSSSSSSTTTTTNSWGSKLPPKVKARIILAGQQRAISNKQKHISNVDRKRRQLLFIKERQQEKKRSAKIDRPIPLVSSSSAYTDIDRIPLHAYQPGMTCFGTCISLTNFGAYIDIGTECDGLLHVTQMHGTAGTGSTDINGRSRSNNNSHTPIASTFINHPKQIVQPGDEISVTVRSINVSRKKLHLTLLPWDIVQEQLEIEQETKAIARAAAASDDDAAASDDDDDDDVTVGIGKYTDRIPISDIQLDDELWGEIKRVTDFGAYVEVGAIVDGFLHYMDHPSFTYEYNHQNPSSKQMIHPTTIMESGDRIRVWVSDIDTIRHRIKLTAHRPSHLPGPRREF